LAAPTAAKGLLGNALQEVYTIIKYRIKNRGDAYKHVAALVTELDLEAKLDTVGSLLVEIHSASPSVQTALRHLHDSVEKIKQLLEKLASDADEQSKRWLAGWRGVSSEMANSMKKLQDGAQVLDTRLDLLLRILAAQPSALESSAAQMEPMGPRHLLHPLEQSWLMVGSSEDVVDEKFQSPQEHSREEIVEPQVQPQCVVKEEVSTANPEPSVPVAVQPPEDIISDKREPSNQALVEELVNMGFLDIEANTRALALAGNNLQMAISMILRDE